MVQLKNIPFDFEVKGQGYEWILVHSVCVNTFVSGLYLWKAIIYILQHFLLSLLKKKVSILRLAV